MSKSISVNKYLCITFTLVFIPVCLFAGFCFFIYSLTLCGGLTYLLTKGKVDQSLWGSLLMAFLSALCFVLEIGFIRLIFFYVSPQKERIFWGFAASLYLIALAILAFSAFSEKKSSNMLIAGLCYCAFYATGSIWALYRVHQFIKNKSLINTET